MVPPKPEAGRFRLSLKIFMGLHCLLYRLTSGRIGGKLSNCSILLLTTVGRKSGKRRTTPLIYIPTERGYALAASFAGADRNPAWYVNLDASHQADIQVLDQHLHVVAEIVGPERRQLLWQQLVSSYPPHAEYQTRTTREIPVVELTPFSLIG